MHENKSIVAFYPSPMAGEAAIKELQQSGFSLPPPIAFSGPPNVIVMPDTSDVYVVPDIDVELRIRFVQTTVLRDSEFIKVPFYYCSVRLSDRHSRMLPAGIQPHEKSMGLGWIPAKTRGVRDAINGTSAIEVCHPQQAKKVLDPNMSVSIALPFAISIYKEDGKTILTTLKPTNLLAIASIDRTTLNQREQT
jgi:hypothetical protein